MLVQLTMASTYISPEGTIYTKDAVYDLPEDQAKKLLSLTDDFDVPRFRIAKQKRKVMVEVDDVPDESVVTGVVSLPDSMKRGNPTPRSRRGRPAKDLQIDSEGELDTAPSNLEAPNGIEV